MPINARNEGDFIIMFLLCKHSICHVKYKINITMQNEELIAEIDTMLAILDDIDVSILVEDSCTVKTSELISSLQKILNKIKSRDSNQDDYALEQLSSAASSLNTNKLISDLSISLEMLNNLSSTLSYESSELLSPFFEQFQAAIEEKNNDNKQLLTIEKNFAKAVEEIDQSKEKSWGIFNGQYLETQKIFNQIRTMTDVKYKLSGIYKRLLVSNADKNNKKKPNESISINWTVNDQSEHVQSKNNITPNKIPRNTSNAFSHLQPYHEIQILIEENNRLRELINKPSLEVDPKEVLKVQNENEKLRERIKFLRSQLNEKH